MCGAEGIEQTFQHATEKSPGIRAYTEEEVESIDRNARAYGWEVGRGAPLHHAALTSPGNPFLDPSWREEIPDQAPEPAQPKSIPVKDHRTDCAGRCQDVEGCDAHARPHCRHTRPELWAKDPEEALEKVEATGEEGDWVDVAPGVRLRLGGEEPDHGEPGENYVEAASGDDVLQTVPDVGEVIAAADEAIAQGYEGLTVYANDKPLSGQIVVWEDPPDREQERADEVLAELKANPGRWARIAHEDAGVLWRTTWWRRVIKDEHVEHVTVHDTPGLFPSRSIYARWTGDNA